MEQALLGKVLRKTLAHAGQGTNGGTRDTDKGQGAKSWTRDTDKGQGAKGGTRDTDEGQGANGGTRDTDKGQGQGKMNVQLKQKGLQKKPGM